MWHCCVAEVLLVSLSHVAVRHESERMRGRLFLSVSHWPRNWGPTALCKHESDFLHCAVHCNIGQLSCGEVKRCETTGVQDWWWGGVKNKKEEGGHGELELRLNIDGGERKWSTDKEKEGINETVKTKGRIEMRLYCSWVGWGGG